jgi:hypothetical protein
VVTFKYTGSALLLTITGEDYTENGKTFSTFENFAREILSLKNLEYFKDVKVVDTKRDTSGKVAMTLELLTK